MLPKKKEKVKSYLKNKLKAKDWECDLSGKEPV
jgi:hypothetical protein